MIHHKYSQADIEHNSAIRSQAEQRTRTSLV